MTSLFTNLFDGVAYGMLLFVLACGLAVTLGLMNFVNLAHGAFAMTGGYVCAVLVNQSGWPFFAALPLAFVASALIELPIGDEGDQAAAGMWVRIFRNIELAPILAICLGS